MLGDRVFGMVAATRADTAWVVGLAGRRREDRCGGVAVWACMGDAGGRLRLGRGVDRFRASTCGHARAKLLLGVLPVTESQEKRRCTYLSHAQPSAWPFPLAFVSHSPRSRARAAILSRAGQPAEHPMLSLGDLSDKVVANVAQHFNGRTSQVANGWIVPGVADLTNTNAR